MTHIANTVIKEFNYAAGKTRVRLVMGFDNDVPAYYAVETRIGDNPLSREDYGIRSQVFGPSMDGYGRAADVFKEEVLQYL